MLALNNLTGPIPPEMGDVASLKWLFLGENQLSGSIPSELGNLADLGTLSLGANRLSGPIPSELGKLTNLTGLYLGDNQLSGTIPPEIGRMSNLGALHLRDNPALAGPLPTELTKLGRYGFSLWTMGTGLCAPMDAVFQAWLGRVNYGDRIAPCVGVDAMAYLTQAVQSREFPVPLLAGEKALLRVFPTARNFTSARVPRMKARFYRNGRETHVVDIPGKSTPLATVVDEGSLARSANAEIPGHVLQPGLEMTIEVDLDRTLDPALGVPTRIPETGRMALDVREMPLFKLTLIPCVSWDSFVDLVEAIAADPENHAMLQVVRTLLPVGSLEVTAHEPVVISCEKREFLRLVAAIRRMEGGTGHYMGIFPWPVGAESRMCQVKRAYQPRTRRSSRTNSATT